MKLCIVLISTFLTAQSFVLDNASDSEEDNDQQNSSLEALIGSLNSRLHGDLLKVTDGQIKINFEPSKELAESYIRTFTAQLGGSPVAEVLGESLIGRIESQQEELKEILNSSPIPVNDVTQALAALDDRPKREVAPADNVNDIVDAVPVNIFDDILNTLLNNPLFGLIRGALEIVLRPVQNLVNSAFDVVTNTLSSLFTSVAPEDGLQNLLQRLVNTGISFAVELIVTVQVAINRFFDALIGPLPPAGALASSPDIPDEVFKHLVKREADPDATDDGNFLTNIISIVISLIQNILAVILSPVNSVVREALLNILSSVYSIVGYVVLTPIRELLLLIIDSIFPQLPAQ